MRGAFKKHPERTRTDAQGAGVFDREPPPHLTGEEKAAWREIVAQLPLVALTGTERTGVTQLARLWAALKDCKPTSGDFKKLDDAFRQWSIQMGLTLQARAKLGTSGRGNVGQTNNPGSPPSRFNRFKD